MPYGHLPFTPASVFTNTDDRKGCGAFVRSDGCLKVALRLVNSLDHHVG